MLKVDQEQRQYAGSFSRFHAHVFNYGSPGEQPQGIWQRIRGGANTTIEVGADVIGHEHVNPAFVGEISIGEEIETRLPDGRYARVELTSVQGLRTSADPDMIKQDGEDELGYKFTGEVVSFS